MILRRFSAETAIRVELLARESGEMTTAAAAKRLGLSQSHVSHVAHSLGISLRGESSRDEVRALRLAERRVGMWKKGVKNDGAGHTVGTRRRKGA